jgi:multidrug efflux pump subunit AcrA (membrane-fusion protein)
MSDDLAKMCWRLSKYVHAQLSGIDLERIANRIERLEAALRNMALDYLAAEGQAAEAYQAQLEAEAKLAKAVEALEYADRMVRIDLFRMTDFNCEDFSQAVVDTGERIKATLAELNCDERSGVATVSEAESEKKGETDD